MRATTSSVETNVPPNLLEHNVQKTIHSQGFARMKDIMVVADEATITLTGEVESFFLKQLAQEVTKNVPGVDCIVNEIEVKDI